MDDEVSDIGVWPGAVTGALLRFHLHAVFAEEGRTVGSTIRQRRLRRCLDDLADPARATTPVSAIALRRGFPNATGFGPSVKGATGRTPVEYRRSMLRGV